MAVSKRERLLGYGRVAILCTAAFLASTGINMAVKATVIPKENREAYKEQFKSAAKEGKNLVGTGVLALGVVLAGGIAKPSRREEKQEPAV